MKNPIGISYPIWEGLSKGTQKMKDPDIIGHISKNVSFNYS